MPALDLDRIFLRYSVEKLAQYTSRIAACLDRLTPEQVWYRGAESQNAVGNLVLHLRGNTGQWILASIAGHEDTRVRDAEFAARGGEAPSELKRALQDRVDAVIAAIQSLSAERLAETIQVQGYSLTVLEAVYHVVEHFAQHTGQIIFATKLATGEDLAFYRHVHSSAPHTETVP